MRKRGFSSRVVLIAALCAPCAGPAAAELQEPAAYSEAPAAPRMTADSARPPSAPTAEAIDAVSREDGAAAGVALATRALAASRIAYGPRDPRTAVPLTNLAHAEQRAGNLAAALRDYRAAIDLSESSGGPRDDHLFEAWYGLAYAHQLAGQADAAAAAYRNALQLHRVNRGLFSTQQLDILHALALATRATGRADDADDLQKRRLDVAERVYGLGTPEVAKLYISVGRWFRNVGRTDDAIALHALAVQILETRSRDDPRLVDPLLELALSGGQRKRQMDQAPLPSSLRPASALSRAEKLIDARSQGTPAEHARTLIRLGDVHMVLGRRAPALRVYAKAAALLAATGEKPPFDEPAFIIFEVPRPEPIPGPGGYVLAEFTVDADGRIDDLRIVETRPASLPPSVAASLGDALRAARLRPRLQNGQAVEARGARYRLLVRGGSA